MTAQRLEAQDHPRSVAIAWWLVTVLCLVLLYGAWSRPDWPYETSRAEVAALMGLVATVLPGLYGLVFGQQLWLDDEALVVRLGRWGLLRARIPLTAIRGLQVVETESLAAFSAETTGGAGRGMICYYTQGRHGIAIVTDRRRYFISSAQPDRLIAQLKGRMAGVELGRPP